MAFTSRAILRASATGAVMSAPLLMTPCGSIVPVGRMTVFDLRRDESRKSIQLMSLMSRVATVSGVWAVAAVMVASKQNEKRYEWFMGVPRQWLRFMVSRDSNNFAKLGNVKLIIGQGMIGLALWTSNDEMVQRLR